MAPGQFQTFLLWLIQVFFVISKAKPQKKPEEVKQEETASAAVTLPNNAASANASAAADAQP